MGPKLSVDKDPSVTILQGGIRSNGHGDVRDASEPILAVGDSFTFGTQVSDRDTWPAQLEKLSGRKVINGGVFGYGIDQAFLRARRLVSRDRFSTVIFSFIRDDIRRCQMSVEFGGAKPYFDFKDGRLTLENVPVPPHPLRPKEGWLLIALEHSRLVHSVMKRLFPKWWLMGQMPWETQVLDKKTGRKVACALLHQLEGLAETRGFELIILVQHTDGKTIYEGPADAMAVRSVLSCLSDPATRVLDLQPVLSELKVKHPSRYKRLFNIHITTEGNELVALELSKILPGRAPGY